MLLLGASLKLPIVQPEILLAEVKQHGEAHRNFEYPVAHAVVGGDGLLLRVRQCRVRLQPDPVNLLPCAVLVGQETGRVLIPDPRDAGKQEIAKSSAFVTEGPRSRAIPRSVERWESRPGSSSSVNTAQDPEGANG